MSFLGSLHMQLSYLHHRMQFFKMNKHNHLVLKHDVNPQSVFVGKGTYGPLYVIKSNKNSKLYIGNYCSIAEKVCFLLDGDHPLDHISTYPFRKKIMHIKEGESISKGDIIIDDDVWIGYGATILSGIHIEKGAVIAAGSVVSKDVPPYAIIAGVPARIIKYRFPQEVINKLLPLDFSTINIEKNIQLLYEPITEENIDSILKEIQNNAE